MKMIPRTTQLRVLGVMALLLVGTGMPSAWADTLSAYAVDAVVDTSDPQNDTGDLGTALCWIGESFANLGKTRGIAVFDMTGIDNTKMETATLTLNVPGAGVQGTGVAEVDMTLLTTPLASHTDDAPSVPLYETASTVVDTINTSAGGGTYTTGDLSAALKALDLSRNKFVVFRIETTAAITWPITGNNRIVVTTAAGATTLDYTLACSAGEGYQDGFCQSIYMGHSFFNPGAIDIAVLAPFYGYSRHTQYRQIAGGTNGDPGSLWRDTGENELAKAEIKKGNVEIVVMTWTGDEADCEFEDYRT